MSIKLSMIDLLSALYYNSVILNKKDMKMLMCDCKKCGGDDEYAFCENALLDAQVSVWRSGKTLGWLVILGLILIGVLAILGI